MELLSFKTNIHNEAAMQKLAPHLDRVVGSPNWQLDIQSADKKLTVFSPGIIHEYQVIAAVKKAGFRAENLDDYYAVY